MEFPLPPPGTTPLYDAAAMHEADAAAGEAIGLPSILLMERAGLGSAAAIMERFPGHEKVTILVGKGNNGGDGYVVARHLAEVGWDVDLVAVDGPPATDDARAMAAIAATLELAARPLDSSEPPPRGVVVDAMLGTGVSGPPRGAIADAVAWLNGGTPAIVSLDVPTGVEADTGVVAGDALVAELTTTYHGDLVGLHIAPGRHHAGDVEVIDIGIPHAVRVSPVAWLASSETASAIPVKGDADEKYAAGAVLTVGGSVGLSGAACLASEAVLRAGGGLSVAVVPEAVHGICAATTAEVMFASCPGRFLGPQAFEEIERQVGRVGAVVIGPGIGRESATRALVGAVLQQTDLPVVVDADALFHLADLTGVLDSRVAPTVLTPHTGEAARLLGAGREEVEAQRLRSAMGLASATRSTVVLKGPGTIVAAPGREPIVNGVDAPALATAGTGDVLAGAIAACLAKGLEAPLAAAAAVALHGLAGTLVAAEGATARDVLQALPAAREVTR